MATDRRLNDVNPDYLAPPGETLAEVLAERGLLPVGLALHAGCPWQEIDAISQGTAPITPQPHRPVRAGFRRPGLLLAQPAA